MQILFINSPFSNVCSGLYPPLHPHSLFTLAMISGSHRLDCSDDLNQKAIIQQGWKVIIPIKERLNAPE